MREFTVSLGSRYVNTPIFQDVNSDGTLSNTFFVGTWEFDEVPNSPDDTFFTVDAAHVGRLDLIAFRAYGNPRLWWVIAHKNLIFDQRSIKTGTVLRIPTRSTVQRILQNA